MTNEEIINAFPECERIKKADVAECINRVFDDVKFYNDIGNYVRQHCFKLWPEPQNWREDRTAYDAWSDYFFGDYEKKDFRFSDWVKELQAEFLNRHGQHRTYEEACQIAADEWARMIFGNHIQDNGDTSEQGFFGNMLATLVKDKAKEGYDEKVVNKFKHNIRKHYLNHCETDDGYRDEPYCDYHPTCSLRDALKKAGCDDKDISYMCPCKTGISIDEGDNSVCVRGYQKRRYI